MASLTKTELNQMIESAVEKAVDKKFGSVTESAKAEVVEESVEALDEAYMQIVEENFLTFVNESAQSKEFKTLIKKVKKGKEVTKEDIKKLEDMLTSEEVQKASQSTKNERALSFLVAMYGLYINILGTTCEVAVLPELGAIITFSAVLTFVVSNFKQIHIAELNMFYDKIMKLEAKAKAELLKLENLDDDKIDDKKKAKIENLKFIISNADKLRNSYKTIVSKLENGKAKTNKGSVYSESVEDFYYVTESGEVEMIQEMKGNAVKKELLKQVLSDLDESLRFRYKYITDIDAGLKDVLKTIESIKTKEEAAQAVVELRKKAREFNYKNQSNEKLKSKAINDTKKALRSFTNKYSFESVQATKAISAKIDKYINNMKKIVEKYDGETGSMNTEIYNAIDKLYLSDSFGDNSQRMIKQFENIILSWQKAMNAMAQDTIDNCDKVQKILGKDEKNGGIKGDKKILFKLLNFKERKAAKKEAEAKANKPEEKKVEESVDPELQEAVDTLAEGIIAKIRQKKAEKDLQKGKDDEEKVAAGDKEDDKKSTNESVEEIFDVDID